VSEEGSVDRGIVVDAIVIAFAAALHVGTPVPAVVERSYSNGIYPEIDRTIRSYTQALPFSLGDVLLIALVLVLFFGTMHIIRDGLRFRRSFFRVIAVLARVVLRWAAVFALLFAWFLAAWGYGYSRVPLAEKVPVHPERVSEDRVDAYADRLVDRLNSEAEAAHTELGFAPEEIARRLTPSWEATIRRLGDLQSFEPYRPKHTLFDRFMTASGTTGFTDPWTHEVNLASSLFAVERPAIYAHEWSHLAGFNDETEANFIAVVACTASDDPLLRYSGHLLTWVNLPSNVHVTHHFTRLPYDDLTAIRNRYLALVQPQVRQATTVAYDRYLKANHVKAGYASYALFVRWMTGADFDASGLPLVKRGT
jgi:hypothetical protein